MAKQRILRARYKTVGPKNELVVYNKCTHNTELGLQIEETREVMPCWRVYFPQGHWIRVTNLKDLTRMGYHIKPRLVDMETGEVVDFGGDPYDFDTPIEAAADPVLLPEDEDDDEIHIQNHK